MFLDYINKGRVGIATCVLLVERDIDFNNLKEAAPHSMGTHIPHKLTRARCDLPWLTSTIK